MARLETANTLINRLMPEVGLKTDPDPVGSQQDTYVQMTALLTAAGRELAELFEWQILEKEFTITTAPGDSGVYDLPDDFSRFINQTGWDRTNRVQIGGPLTPQNWSYLEGRDLVSQSIYASYRLSVHKLELFPQPPPEGLDIRFEYISRNWVLEASLAGRDDIDNGSNIVLLEPILITKFLKCKWLEAKGFDASAARMEFENILESRRNKDKGAPTLNAARASRGVPYINSYYNTPDTGYGVV